MNKKQSCFFIVFLISLVMFFFAMYDFVDLGVTGKYLDDPFKDSTFLLAKKNNALLLVQTLLSMFLSIINIRKSKNNRN